MIVQAGHYQDLFLHSQSKFPALITAIGTGKTLSLSTKVHDYCDTYPNSTGLIIRKEFTDLRDSTMKDFQQYFDCSIGVDKNYYLPNGSLIMFRHGDELDVLKNINLAIAGIEQAEEFKTDTQFQFIRDRLRQMNGAKVRPLCIIANANGHNWIWKLWINGALEVVEIDKATGQYQYINGQYDAITANTFANERNLPKDFIDDLKRMEVESPNHFRQYVMNNFEEMNEDDYVFSFDELLESRNKDFVLKQGFGHKVMGFDIARFGNDKCCAYGFQQLTSLYWSEFHVEEWGHKDLDYSTGRILSISMSNRVDDNIIDEEGMGAGPTDTICHGKGREDFEGFRNKTYGFDDNKEFANARTMAAFKLKDLVKKGFIRIMDEKTIQELMTLRYRYTNDGRKILLSKDEMRKHGIASPNRADACLMAVTLIGKVRKEQENMYTRPRQNQVARETSLFGIAGVR